MKSPFKPLTLDDGREEIVRADASAANGMTLDCDGRLVVFEQGGPGDNARISRLDRTTLHVETVVDAHGTISFTDPSYGHLQGAPNRAAAR